jgi:hypothetical protein
MTDVFCEGAAGTGDCDEAGLDGDRDALRDVEFFSLEDVPHLGRSCVNKCESVQYDVHPAQLSSFSNQNFHRTISACIGRITRQPERRQRQISPWI